MLTNRELLVKALIAHLDEEFGGYKFPDPDHGPIRFFAAGDALDREEWSGVNAPLVAASVTFDTSTRTVTNYITVLFCEGEVAYLVFEDAVRHEYADTSKQITWNEAYDLIKEKLELAASEHPDN